MHFCLVQHVVERSDHSGSWNFFAVFIFFVRAEIVQITSDGRSRRIAVGKRVIQCRAVDGDLDVCVRARMSFRWCRSGGLESVSGGGLG